MSLNRDNRSVFAVWFSSTCFLPAAEPSQSHGCFLFSSPRRASCRLAAETDDCCVFSSSADFQRSLWRETQRCSQTLQLMFNAAGRVGSRQQRPELNPALANMWTSAECCRDGAVMEDATSEEVTSHSVWVSEENSSSPSTGSGSPQQTETQQAIKKIKPVWLKLMQRLNWSYMLSPSLPGSQ